MNEMDYKIYLSFFFFFPKTLQLEYDEGCFVSFFGVFLNASVPKSKIQASYYFIFRCFLKKNYSLSLRSFHMKFYSNLKQQIHPSIQPQ